MKEKNMIRRFLELAAVVCLMALMLGMTSLAADKVEGIAFGQTVTNTDEDASITHYYKFTVKKSGVINISAAGVSGNYPVGLNISLCNAKGKVLSTDYVNAMSSYTDSQSVTFGVNQGTYRIKVQTPYRFVLAATYKSWPEKNGKTRTKAVSLKKKAVKKGVVGIGESAKKADWYKITLTKPAKIKLEFSVSANNYIYATIMPSKKTKINGSGVLSARNGTVENVFYSTGNKKLPAGTYYIRVWRGNYANSSTNGIYTLKWK